MAPPPLIGPVFGLDGGDRGAPVRALQGDGQVLVDRACPGRWPDRSRPSAVKSPPLVSVKSLLPEVMSVKLALLACRGRVERRPHQSRAGRSSPGWCPRRGPALVGAATLVPPNAVPGASRSSRPRPGRRIGRVRDVGHGPAGVRGAPVRYDGGPTPRRSRHHRLPPVRTPGQYPAAARSRGAGRGLAVPHHLRGGRGAASAPSRRRSRRRAGSRGRRRRGRWCRWSGRAVLGARVARRGDHRLPLEGHALEDRRSRSGGRRPAMSASQSPQLVVTTWERVVAGDPVEEVEGLRRRCRWAPRRRRSDAVGALNDGQLDIEGRLARSLGGPPAAAVDDACCGSGWSARSTTRTPRSRWRQVLLELDDGDRLADAGAPLREELVEPEDRRHLRRGVGPAEGRALRRRRRPGASRRGPIAWPWLPGWRCSVGAAVPAASPGAPGAAHRRVPASMECSWNRPSRPTTPVTAPAREAGICGDAVLTRAWADSGDCTVSSGVPKAAETTVARCRSPGSSVAPGFGRRPP